MTVVPPKNCLTLAGHGPLLSAEQACLVADLPAAWRRLVPRSSSLVGQRSVGTR